MSDATLSHQWTSIPEVILQHRVGVVAEEQEAIDVAERLHLQRELDPEQPAVGSAAGGLVDEPHRAVQQQVDRQDAPLPQRAADEGADQEDGDGAGDPQAVPDDPVVTCQTSGVDAEAGQCRASQPGEIVDRDDGTERHSVVELGSVGHDRHGLPG